MITFEPRKINLAPGARVLDIGCGSGRHAAAVYHRWQAFVVAADRNPDHLAEAGQKLAWHNTHGFHCHGTWHLAGADITRLPFAAGSFDLVICSEVLEHVPDHMQAVAEISRVTRPGGQLVISVPCAWPERLCWKFSSPYRHSPGGHIRIYTRSGLLHILARAGLQYQGHHFAHSLHTPYWLLRCLVGLEDEDQPLVSLYKRFLNWYVLKNPSSMAWLEKILNPIMGKSLVIYCRKPSFQTEFPCFPGRG